MLVYRDPLIYLRALPTRTLPSRPPNPFPDEVNQEQSFRAKHPLIPVVGFGVISSKNNVSKLASERLRVRSRIKAAIEAVVHRSIGLKAGQRGSDMIGTGESIQILEVVSWNGM